MVNGDNDDGDDDDDDDNNCHEVFLFLSWMLLYTISNIAQKNGNSEQTLILKRNNKIYL